MISKKLSVRAEADNIITAVEYDFDGEKVVTDVLHFQPQNEEEIEASIATHGAYLQKKREAAARCTALAAQISTE